MQAPRPKPGRMAHMTFDLVCLACQSQRLWRNKHFTAKICPCKKSLKYRTAEMRNAKTAKTERTQKRPVKRLASACDGDGPGWCHSEVQFPAGPRAGRFLPVTTKGMCSARFLSSAFVAAQKAHIDRPSACSLRHWTASTGSGPVSGGNRTRSVGPPRSSYRPTCRS